MTDATERGTLPPAPSLKREGEEWARSAAPPDRGRLRVWLLTNAPSPYQSELFTAVSRLPDVDLAVRFMRSSSPAGSAVASDFNQRVLTGLGLNRWPDEVRLHPRAVWEAATGDFDCYVLSGLASSLTFQLCELVLRLRRKPVAVWLERPHAADSAKWFPRLRRWLRRNTLSGAQRVWCIGTQAAREYGALLRDPSKLLVLPYCCDTERYRTVDADAVRRVRNEHGLDGRFVFLFSGQLIPRKGVDALLTAFAQVAEKHPSAALLILGDGPLRNKMEASVPDALRSRVRFVGRVDQSQLPVCFRAADAFVFPSRHDGWGVVLNEACAAGLPIIATPQTGAAHDLLRDGENGFLVERDDIDGFARAMTVLLENPARAREFGEMSRQLVEPYSAANGAKLFRDHVRSTIVASR